MKKQNACKKQLPWLLLGAVLTALTLVYPKLGFVQWLSMIPMIVGVYRLCDGGECTAPRAWGYGFLTVWTYYFVIYHWFVNLYPLDFVGMDNASSAVVIAAGWLGLPILQALLGGFVFLLYFWIHKSGFFARLPLARPFVFAALWVVFEFASTLGWTGVPWGRLALGQIEFLPMLQSASLLGSYFVSWLLLMVNGLLAYAGLYRRREAVCLSLAGGLLVSNLAFGLIFSAFSAKSEPNTIKVAVIQGNINSHEKWSSESYRITRETYGELTKEAAAEGAELVVWPETAFPSALVPESTNGKFVSDLARECNVTLLVGALKIDDEGNEYNALFLVDPNGTIREEFYAKRHLVPFGEYVPMREVIMTLIPPLANLSALGEDLTPGTDPALFTTKWGEIGSLICFDSIYEQLTIDSVRDGADLMVISSNDSWFYDSAAVYQHQAQAQLRAIESGRYFVRAANTGISTVISEKGELLAWIDPLERGYATAEVTVCEGNTLYTHVGNLFVYLCAALASLALLCEPLCRVARFLCRRRNAQ